MEKFRTILLFGPPGAGKGTQGKVLSQLPGFFHCACGDVFRTLDAGTRLGRLFFDYSSRGELVPDEVTVELWETRIDEMIAGQEFHPASEVLVLDGIPRNRRQAELLDEKLDVTKVMHLTCRDEDVLVERMKQRALRNNRYDDANEETIRNRLTVYRAETSSVLEFYPPDVQVEVNALQHPTKVLLDLVASLQKVAPAV